MKKIGWVVVTVIVIILVVLGFANRDQNTAIDDGTVLKIGALQPINAGTGSAYGEYGQRGMSLALEDLNAVAGARKIELTIEDSEGQAKSAISAMNKLVAQGHKFVVGDQISGVTLSVAPIAEENKIIHIAPGSSNPKVTDAGDYTFRTKVSATVESKAVTAYLVDDLKITSAAFLYQNSDYGKGVFNAVKADLDAGEIAITASESFEVGATDLRTQLLKIKATNPDIIVLTGFAKEVGQIMKQAKELGVTAKFIAHSGSIGPDIVKVGGASADGLLALLETSPDMSDPRTKSFYDRYISRYKEEPEVFTLLAYDTLILLGNQVRACDEDVECVKKGLYKLKEEGITGTMSFDKNGDIVRNSFTLFTIKDSKFVSVK